MARNNSENKEADIAPSGPRRTVDEQKRQFTNSTQKALKLASEGEKYRYKSTRDLDRFVKYLRSKLEMWEELKDKSFHATRMYNKTVDLLSAIE